MRTPRSPDLRLVQSGGAAESISDEQIVAAVCAREPDAGQLLYDHLISTVEATLYRVLGGRDRDHRDLVQASFEQVFATLVGRKFRGRCSLRTWATAIATRVALKTLRGRGRERGVFSTTDEPATAVDAADHERRLVARSELERVRRELAQLSPKRAEAVVLHDVLGHELSEIATSLGISVSAAQSRLVRGRRELLDRLRTEGTR